MSFLLLLEGSFRRSSYEVGLLGIPQDSAMYPTQYSWAKCGGIQRKPW